MCVCAGAHEPANVYVSVSYTASGKMYRRTGACANHMPCNYSDTARPNWIKMIYNPRLLPGGVEPLKKYNKMQVPKDKMPIK